VRRGRGSIESVVHNDNVVMRGCGNEEKEGERGKDRYTIIHICLSTSVYL
jgi:hypothetical protein